MLLGLMLAAGFISFLITFILYKPLLYGWFENILIWRLGNDMSLEQMENMSKGTIMGIFISFIIIPLAIIIFLIVKLLRKWLNKPLGPRTTKISDNEKSIVRKSLKLQKISSGVISSSTALILASTIASSASIVLVPSYKNRFFSNMIKLFSFPLNYGNSYNQNWQRLYSFLDSADEHQSGINGLRNLIQFSSFQGDIYNQTSRLNSALSQIDTKKLNDYFAKIENSSYLTDTAFRVLLGKFISGIKHQIMAKDKNQVANEKEFDNFLSSFKNWANSINKNNLHMNNGAGIKKAIEKLLSENHNYEDTYYFKNKTFIEDLIDANKKLVKQSENKYKELVYDRNVQMKKYNSDFSSIKKIAINLQNKIDDFINIWESIGKGNVNYAKNDYPTIPQSILTFVNSNEVTKDLHIGLPVLYSEKNGANGPDNESAPLGRTLLNNNLRARGSLSSASNTLIQEYITAYKNIYGNSGSESNPEQGSPRQEFLDAQRDYNNAKNTANQQLQILNNYKYQKSQKEREISSNENQLKNYQNRLQSLTKERDNLVNSINNQISKFNSKNTEKNNAKTEENRASNEYQRYKSLKQQAQSNLDTAKNALIIAQNNYDNAKTQLDQTDKQDVNYQNRKNAVDSAKSNLDHAKQQETTAKNKLKQAQSNETDAKNHWDRKVEKSNKLASEYKSMQNKLDNDIWRLNILQGPGASRSGVSRISLPGGEIGNLNNDITNTQRRLASRRRELPTIQQNIDSAQNDYDDAKNIERQKENIYQHKTNIHDQLLNVLNNKINTYNSTKNRLNQILAELNNDFTTINDYVKSVPSQWNYFVQNSIRRWEIQGDSNSFNPRISSVPKINPPAKTDPTYIGWEPPAYDEISYGDKAKGGASLIYLTRKLKYLNKVLLIADDINISMENTYEERLESLANTITKILT